jgi:hypothetical protein
MEIEEFCMFPGCCLVEHESCLAKGVANAEVLESVGATEDDDWIRRCHQLLGGGGMETGADH